MFKILILGGTRFIGRHVVSELHRRGTYDLTLFNRGVTNPGLFPDLKHLRGNRDTEDIEQIADQNWDCVLDLSCYHPHVLQRTLDALQSRVQRYVFVSSCSVYDHAHDRSELKNELTTRLRCAPNQQHDDSPTTYGARKAECERLLADMQSNHVILRPALVFGPFDPTDRLYYWLYVAKQHKKLYLPSRGDMRFSLTYVKDLVELIVQSLETIQTPLAYNAVSYPQFSIRRLLDRCIAQLGVERTLVDVDASALQSHDFQEWTDIPLWLNTNAYTYDNSSILCDHHITLTPFEQALEETIAYYAAQGWPAPGFGLPYEDWTALLDQQ